MNLLLDTCALVALAQGNLTPTSQDALRGAGEAFISPIVPWELAIKQKNGKLILPKAALDWVNALATRHSLSPPTGGLDAGLLCAAANLPLIHRDPFDRVLIATAQHRNLTIMTSDTIVPSYPDILTIW